MNLIDKDLLLTKLTELELKDPNFVMGQVKGVVGDMIVIEERKHGHWIEEELNDWDAELISRWRCSVCNSPTGTLTSRGSYPAWKACPMCTAIMDEEEVY